MPLSFAHDLADHIDPDRARALREDSERPEEPGVVLATLLASAYPALRTNLRWQREGLTQIALEGWDSTRTAADYANRFNEACGDLQDPALVLRGLRRVSWIEKARIALRELIPRHRGGGGIDETAQELSLLASVAYEVALTEATMAVDKRWGPPLAEDGTRSSIVVLGMGKLGGYELNAGSDVDVIYIYDSDEGQSEISLHDHWSRVATRAAASLEEQTEDGSVWRVDLRLRPEGSRGPVVNSVAAAERYYETWGRSWERAAMLRARPIAGDRQLGELLDRELITPFVYRNKVDPSIATRMIELVQRSRIQLSKDPERDLKLGPGGIREAEFFVQSLQLIWGGKDPSLRTPSTLVALERLQARGLVTHQEAQEVGEAYWLLRRAEHAVQWSTGVQTHLLPAEPDDLERLARALAFESASQLMSRLGRARDLVAERFASLAPETPMPPSRFHHILCCLELGGLELEKAVSESLGNAEAAEHLETLARRPDGPLGSLSRERYPLLADAVLEALIASPDPELAARTLRAFFGRLSDPGPYVRPLGENPRAARRFVTLLGASAFIGDALVANPGLADVVMVGGSVPGDAHAKDTVALELAAAHRDGWATADRYEQHDRLVRALRRAKSRVTVEVAAADLSEELGTREATGTLAALADTILDEAVRHELQGDTTGLVVIAVGKLGGRDIGYGSDLDVLFVYDGAATPEGKDPAEYFTRAAQRIIRLISEPHPAGRGYELDTRLRPSGAQGLLVTTLAAFARYHGVTTDGGPKSVRSPSVLSSGAAWERQALLRARVCAGDRELGDRVLAVAHEAAFGGGAPEAQEMHHLRLRMQKELANESETRRDLKTGRGGLLDVEFAVQWLQMRHGDCLAVRTTDVGVALAALNDNEFLEQRDFEVLRDGYLFLRRLEQRMHVRTGVSRSDIDRHLPGLPELARRMGFRDTARGSAENSLWQDYERTTEAIRASYLKVLALGSERPPG